MCGTSPQTPPSPDATCSSPRRCWLRDGFTPLSCALIHTPAPACSCCSGNPKSGPTTLAADLNPDLDLLRKRTQHMWRVPLAAGSTISVVTSG